MMFPVLKIVILTFSFQWVQPQKYLLESGTISFFRIKAKRVKNHSVKYLTTIDHHLFADAVDIKVRTNYMNLYEGAVKNLPHLKILRLKECGVQTLAPKAFKNLPNLQKVHLQDNDLTIIESGVFNFLPIQELWLQRNEISTIRSEAFDNMPNLESISLNGNMLKKWDNRWFVNTPKLTNLFFRKNELTELPARAFANIQTSHKVDGVEIVDTKIFLSHNRIFEIHPEALKGIDSLDELCLRKNKLKKIDSRLFEHMSELHTLNLAENFLSEIEKNLFGNLNEILVLDLSRNFFKCVPYGVVSSVKSVVVSGNEDLSCDCLYNLRSKLREDKIENQIVAGGLECAYEEEDFR